jgi:hypothetical protein
MVKAAHLANEVRALAEALAATLGRFSLGLADLEKGLGNAVHKLCH